MARIFFWIFTENKPVRGLRKKYNIPDVNWLKNGREVGGGGEPSRDGLHVPSQKTPHRKP